MNSTRSSVEAVARRQGRRDAHFSAPETFHTVGRSGCSTARASRLGLGEPLLRVDHVEAVARRQGRRDSSNPSPYSTAVSKSKRLLDGKGVETLSSRRGYRRPDESKRLLDGKGVETRAATRPRSGRVGRSGCSTARASRPRRTARLRWCPACRSGCSTARASRHQDERELKRPPFGRSGCSTARASRQPPDQPLRERDGLSKRLLDGKGVETARAPSGRVEAVARRPGRRDAEYREGSRIVAPAVETVARRQGRRDSIVTRATSTTSSRSQRKLDGQDIETSRGTSTAPRCTASQRKLDGQDIETGCPSPRWPRREGSSRRKLDGPGVETSATRATPNLVGPVAMEARWSGHRDVRQASGMTPARIVSQRKLDGQDIETGGRTAAPRGGVRSRRNGSSMAGASRRCEPPRSTLGPGGLQWTLDGPGIGTLLLRRALASSKRALDGLGVETVPCRQCRARRVRSLRKLDGSGVETPRSRSPRTCLRRVATEARRQGRRDIPTNDETYGGGALQRKLDGQDVETRGQQVGASHGGERSKRSLGGQCIENKTNAVCRPLGPRSQQQARRPGRRDELEIPPPGVPRQGCNVSSTASASRPAGGSQCQLDGWGVETLAAGRCQGRSQRQLDGLGVETRSCTCGSLDG